MNRLRLLRAILAGDTPRHPPREHTSCSSGDYISYLLCLSYPPSAMWITLHSSFFILHFLRPPPSSRGATARTQPHRYDDSNTKEQMLAPPCARCVRSPTPHSENFLRFNPKMSLDLETFREFLRSRFWLADVPLWRATANGEGQKLPQKTRKGRGGYHLINSYALMTFWGLQWHGRSRCEAGAANCMRGCEKCEM